MAKRLVNLTFPVALGMVLLVLVVVNSLLFLDWVADLLGEEKIQMVSKFITWCAIGIWGLGVVAVIGGWMVAFIENNNMEKMKVFLKVGQVVRREVRLLGRAVWEKVVFLFLIVVGAVGLGLFVLLFLVMFDGNIECWAKTTLGILGKNSKQDTIEFIGWGIAGILGFFGAVAVNRRANTQAKGYIQERFNAAVEHLGSARTTARIASFHEFYYLACDNNGLRESIFDILCAHLRQATTSEKYEPRIKIINNKGNFKDVKPTEEVRSLLDILFQPKGSQGELIFAGLQAKLQGVFLVGANLHWANFRNADLQYVDLRGASLWDADLQDVNLWGADLRGADLRRADLRCADLRDAIFMLTVLVEAKLQGAKLQDTNLRDADLQDAELRDAYLQGTNLELVKNLNMEKLSKKNTEGAKFPAGH